MVTLNNAKEVTSKLVKSVHPVSVILFGSVASIGSGNDLDLLIVIDDDSSDDKMDKLIYKNLHEFSSKFEIDPFIVSISKLRSCYFSGSPFLRLIQRNGRLLYMKNFVRHWFKQAEEELKIAKYLFEGNFYSGTCYHSQQVIEKAIKGALLQKGWELEKIHNVERLLAVACDFNIPLEVTEDDIIFMDSIYRGRYTADEGILPLGDPTDKEAEKALHLASEIFQKIKNIVG